MFFVTCKKKFTKLKQFTFTSYSFYLPLNKTHFIYMSNEFDEFMKCTLFKMKDKMI